MIIRYLELSGKREGEGGAGRRLRHGCGLGAGPGISSY